jgi:hypothetical protein
LQLLKGIQKFDWRSLNKFASSKAADDLNVFLEKLPHNSSKTMLIVAGVIWANAAAMGLFTTMKMQEFSEISAAKAEAGAVLPRVPTIKDTAVDAGEVKTFVDELQKTYKGLEIAGSSSNIMVRAKGTSQFGEFREAVGHIQNGGSGWRVNIDRLCVGKECQQFPLSASLKINKVSVE